MDIQEILEIVTNFAEENDYAFILGFIDQDQVSISYAGDGMLVQELVLETTYDIVNTKHQTSVDEDEEGEEI